MFCLISRSFPQYLPELMRLGDCGILAFWCTYRTALRECDRLDVGGVAIELDEHPEDGLALLSELQRTYPDMPIAVICNLPFLKLPPRVVRLSTAHEAAPMLDALLQFCIKGCRFCTTGRLTLPPLSLSLDDREWTYMNEPLPLPSNCHRLLYILLYYAPRKIRMEDLAMLCGYGGKSGAAQLQSLICSINQAVKPSLKPLVLCTKELEPVVWLNL